MPKFLVDENLSPLLAHYLRELKYQTVAVRDVGLKGKSDEEILKWIKRKKTILVTADREFGEFFYLKNFGQIGIIILESRSQSFKSFQTIIKILDKESVLKRKDLYKILVIATQWDYRIREYNPETV